MLTDPLERRELQPEHGREETSSTVFPAEEGLGGARHGYPLLYHTKLEVGCSLRASESRLQVHDRSMRLRCFNQVFRARQGGMPGRY